MKRRAGATASPHSALGLRRRHARPQHRHQPRIPRQAEHIVDPLSSHQPISSSVENALNRRAAGSSPAASAGEAARTIRCHLLQRARRRTIDVRGPKLRRQQMIVRRTCRAADNSDVVVAMEDQRLLLLRHAPDRPSRPGPARSARGGLRCRRHELLHEQRLDRRRPMADLVIRPRLRGAQLQPVQRRLAGQRRAVPAASPATCRPAPPSPDRGAAYRGRSDPRSPARCRAPAGPPGCAAHVRSASDRADPRSRRPSDRSARPPDRWRQAAARQRPRSSSRHRTRRPRNGPRRVQIEQIRVTVCGHRGVPPVRDKPLLHKALSQIRSPDAATV